MLPFDRFLCQHLPSKLTLTPHRRKDHKGHEDELCKQETPRAAGCRFWDEAEQRSSGEEPLKEKSGNHIVPGVKKNDGGWSRWIS